MMTKVLFWWSDYVIIIIIIILSKDGKDTRWIINEWKWTSIACIIFFSHSYLNVTGTCASAKALYRACCSVGSTISTDLDRRAPVGTVSVRQPSSGGFNSSVFACDTFEKHESTEAARSLLRSGTARNISLTTQSTAGSLCTLSRSKPFLSDAATFSSEFPVGSTKIASWREMERRRWRFGKSSQPGGSSIVGEEGNNGGEPGVVGVSGGGSTGKYGG